MLPLTAVTLLVCCALTECSVFLDRSAAGQILRRTTRRRRANTHVLEEIMPGNLERECYEEKCSQEEAAEIFQTREKVLEFWFQYTNLNPCQTNPCLNGGLCTLDRGDFLCLCGVQYRGKTCDTEVVECNYKNGGCLQYCQDLPGGAGVQCGCADGFELESDGRSCSQTAAFPCGRQHNVRRFFDISRRSLMPSSNASEPEEEVTPANETWPEYRAGNETANETWPDYRAGNETELGMMTRTVGGMTRIVGGVLERRGGSPWQVLIHRSDGYGFCGGTLVSERWVVSAAHCFEMDADYVTIGDLDKRRPDPGEQLIKVQKVFIHPFFHAFTFDSDVALLYLSRNATRGPTVAPACLPDPHLSQYLLRDGNFGMVTGWGVTRYLGKSSRFLRKVTLPVVSYRKCRATTEQVITDNMFCAGYLHAEQDACSGDSGGPFVVNYRGTWFLTGVVSWGEKCAAEGKFGVYTRLGNFLNWIRDTMESADVNATET